MDIIHHFHNGQTIFDIMMTRIINNRNFQRMIDLEAPYTKQCYFTILNEQETISNVPVGTGLCVFTYHPQNKISFGELNRVFKYDNDGVYLRQVFLPTHIPKHYKCRTNDQQYTNMVILGKRYDLRKSETYNELIQLGLDVVSDVNVIYWTSKQNYIDATRYLISIGANVKTAIYSASKFGNLDLIISVIDGKNKDVILTAVKCMITDHHLDLAKEMISVYSELLGTEVIELTTYLESNNKLVKSIKSTKSTKSSGSPKHTKPKKNNQNNNTKINASHNDSIICFDKKVQQNEIIVNKMSSAKKRTLNIHKEIENMENNFLNKINIAKKKVLDKIKEIENIENEIVEKTVDKITKVTNNTDTITQAIISENLNLLDLLISQESDINHILYLACINNKKNVIDYLIDNKGANYEQVHKQLLDSKHHYKNDSTVKYLAKIIMTKCQIENVTDIDEIHQVSKKHYFKEPVHIPLGLGKDDDLSPIMVACRASKNDDQLDLVKMLVSYGSNINSRDKIGRTALHFAINGSNKKIIEYLLSLGADYSFRDNIGDTPIMLAKKSNNLELLDLFQSVSKDINTIDKTNLNQDIKTVMSICLSSINDSQFESIQKLIVSGFNVNSKDNTKKTLLHMAVVNNNLRIVELLINSGININSQDNLGKTPLMLACQYSHRDSKLAIVEFLLNNNAKILIKAKNNMTAIDLMSKTYNNNIYNLLCERLKKNN
ncbi:ankyrin repeat-containing protein [Acanthamoeba polyphaga mimivirus]|uniref:Ankyrin repeat-containing protein n=1 Tax=Acanthamoeba polyphaga mimivirus Kroon TaxID=3069720 RepID=A0A0G2Y642_9VIRU|nr:ankyrin repeat-containing protein [Acanthamoeba polyphaga mimivirus]AKI80004.1 ankyrin repeat-containing protein [Acanthamoeba polyphaga mimivirus Kroon]